MMPLRLTTFKENYETGVTISVREETLPEDSVTTEPTEEEAPEGETTAEEETTEPEDIGDIEEEEENTSITIPANSLTIIIAEGKIEVK